MKIPDFIIHDLEQGLFLAQISKKFNKRITFYSAPGAVGSIGPLIFKSIITEVNLQFPNAKLLAILDCGCEPGFAMSAIRLGISNIHVNLRGKMRINIEEIALANRTNIFNDSDCVIRSLMSRVKTHHIDTAIK